jgi:glutamate dehydrogenase (NAD(P)+)
MVINRACERLGWNLADQRCVVQGFGKVGGVAAAELAARGATVVGIGDYSGGLYDENGLDVAELMAWTAESAALADWQGSAMHATNAALLEQPCDVLVLAALEDQLTAENAPRIQARMVAEGANGPTSLEADEILLERGIPVLPDILTNAGGVTVSYFEWVQDIGRFFWDRDEIRSRLAEKMATAFDRVWDLSEERQVTLRAAALVCGIREVAAALQARGLFP